MLEGETHKFEQTQEKALLKLKECTGECYCTKHHG